MGQNNLDKDSIRCNFNSNLIDTGKLMTNANSLLLLLLDDTLTKPWLMERRPSLL